MSSKFHTFTKLLKCDFREHIHILCGTYTRRCFFSSIRVGDISSSTVEKYEWHTSNVEARQRIVKLEIVMKNCEENILATIKIYSMCSFKQKDFKDFEIIQNIPAARPY